LKRFDQEDSSRSQQILRGTQGGLGELSRPCLVGHAHSAEFGGHVGENDIDWSAAPLSDLGECRRLTNVADQANDRRGQWIDRLEVDPDHQPTLAHPLGGHLQPAAGPGAEVDDTVARTKESEAIVQLDQLVRRARAVTCGFGARIVSVFAPVHDEDANTSDRTASSSKAPRLRPGVFPFRRRLVQCRATMDLADLNPAQREAVLHCDGALLILAGAGSGKTRVLTYRFAHLVRRLDVPADRICAVTFTNKAAGEMRERVKSLLGGANPPWLATFHSLCARLLRRHAECLGMSRDFVIYDDADQLSLLRRVCTDLDLSEQLFPPPRLAHAIDRAKNDDIRPEDLSRRASDVHSERIALAYRRYQALLEANEALDFGDLLLRTCDLFRANPGLLASYQERFRYLMVDEFQDTNRAQYLLLRLLAGERGSVCVVGDDDQSIYRWRGADVRNILEFERDFPGAHVIRLEQNYRSTQTILDAAGAVIAHNRSRKGKTLWTENGNGTPLSIYSAADERAEGFWVRQQIEQARREGARLGDVAVFYRTNAQSRAVEDELARSGLPYSVVGGLKFYERKEVKDLLAYLRVLANPRDTVSLLRIINTPPRGIGPSTIEALESSAREHGRPLREILLDPPKAALTPAAATRVASFAATLSGLREVDRDTVTPLLRRVIEDSGYLDRLLSESTPESESRAENVRELLTVTEDFDAHAPESGESGLTAFLERLALVTDLDGLEESPDRVTLMTLHNSKGLEFPLVFMIGVEEGLFPHERSIDNPEAIEEERRLCYVGMTRARRRLSLVHAWRRHLFGRVQHNPPSRFLDEIPDHLVRRHGDEDRDEARGPDEPTIDYSYSQLDHHPRAHRRVESGGIQRNLPGGIRTGSRVRHRDFGEGVVRRIEGSGDQCKITVVFDRWGSKKLIQKFARLESVLS
jgi:DNA helicase-2/ATP-dependent DNA helicase PcrA